ncbi:hypothetical protein UCMB321_0506 [Pseudomonas batumici]|uniref:Uncharacterized protein n=1 Tax=Pseudomonas batumici TaxID=226910 RepID=A0A0C2ILB1_9PSED|nr:hypothetical protein UCMB321_0506 [Pseudomonas batumici]
MPGVGFDLRVQSLHHALRRGRGHPCWGLHIILSSGIINPNHGIGMPLSKARACGRIHRGLPPVGRCLAIRPVFKSAR